MSEKYKNLKVKDLQELLQKNGLSHTGKKDELIERLVTHDEHKALELESLEAEFGNLEEFDESKLNLDELADPELGQLESKDKPTETEVTTTKVLDTTNPTDDSTATSQQGPIVKEGSGFKFNPIVFDKKPTSTPSTTNDVSKASPKGDNTEKAPLSVEAERKLERAKRFGVQVDEKTKQELRAARFGIQKTSPTQQQSPTKASPVQQKKAPKGLDPEVLKKRAQRFGLPEKTTKSAKPTTTALSPEDEEKKRKRAERFGVDSNKKAKN